MLIKSNCKALIADKKKSLYLALTIEANDRVCEP